MREHGIAALDLLVSNLYPFEATLAAGKQPEVDVKIVFTGIRPGEKLHERLYREEEHPTPAGVPGLLRIDPGALDWPALQPSLDALQAAAEGRESDLLRASLARIVPDYRLPEPLTAA